MKEIFFSLLTLLQCKGNITEVAMYPSGIFSKISIKTESGTYEVTITKEPEEEKKDA